MILIFCLNFSVSSSNLSSLSSGSGYNRKSTPWRGSDLDLSSSGSANYRPVKFKNPSGSFGAFNPSANNSIPVGGVDGGFSDL